MWCRARSPGRSVSQRIQILNIKATLPEPGLKSINAFKQAASVWSMREAA